MKKLLVQYLINFCKSMLILALLSVFVALLLCSITELTKGNLWYLIPLCIIISLMISVGFPVVSMIIDYDPDKR